jgi:hypothetical protein
MQYDKNTRGGAVIWIVTRALAFAGGWLVGWITFFFVLAIVAGIVL